MRTMVLFDGETNEFKILENSHSDHDQPTISRYSEVCCLTNMILEEFKKNNKERNEEDYSDLAFALADACELVIGIVAGGTNGYGIVGYDGKKRLLEYKDDGAVYREEDDY